MTTKHSFEILQAGSHYVGRQCPVSRKELEIGEQIIVCHRHDEVFSWDALPVLEGNCPYCKQKIVLEGISGISDKTHTSSVAQKTNQIGSNHELIVLNANSPQIGEMCPVRRKRFQQGDSVVFCRTHNILVSQESVSYMNGYCPICGNYIGHPLPSQSEPSPKLRLPDSPQKLRHPAPERRPAISNRILLFGAILLIGIFLGSLFLVWMARSSTTKNLFKNSTCGICVSTIIMCVFPRSTGGKRWVNAKLMAATSGMGNGGYCAT